MRVDTLPRVMAFCIVGFGVPMGSILLIRVSHQGPLSPSTVIDVILTLIVGGALMGVALWYAVVRGLVEAKRLAWAMKREKHSRKTE